MGAVAPSLSAEEAVAQIWDGSRVVVPPGPAADGLVLKALGERVWSDGIELYASAGRLPPQVVANSRIRLFDWQLSGAARELHKRGRLSYVPLRYSDFPKAFAYGGALAADVLLLRIPPPDESGNVSPGLCGAIGMDILRDTPLVIAEVNRGLPFTFGTNDACCDELDAIVELDEPLTVPSPPESTEAETAIAQNVVDLVEDGATIQFGTGSIVESVLVQLRGRRHLGLHSGMVTGGIQPLIESGVIDNSRKGYLDGYSVAGMVIGPPSFMSFVHRNPEFRVASATVSHGLEALSRLDRFTTVNSAIEVDLSGQINAEYLDGQFSGVGGQADYTYAASTSPRPGRAIIALPSTSSQGDSRIVGMLRTGAIVTTPRYCVDFVVTEFGIADLRFQSLDERARRLTAIAHPTHREELQRQFRGATR